MAATTSIAWADSTFNPWIGCTKVGPGCDHCYAEAWDRRFAVSGHAMRWGLHAKRTRTSAANWRKPLQWQANAAAFQAEHGRRQRVFCSSLADVFDNAVDPAWRADLFDLIKATPDLDWLLLTKRIGNAWKMMADACGWSQASLKLPLPNVWLGATIVNQEEAERDIPKLLAVPARVRFLSMEPLLGPVDIGRWLGPQCDHGSATGPDGVGGVMCPLCMGTSCGACQGLSWVIVGGESGSKARPMYPGWARSLRDQCAAAGVPMLFKQWGEWTPGENVERVRGTVDTAFLWDEDNWSVHPLNLATDHGHIDDQPDLYRVGKKAAGRLLDGCTHDAFPVAAFEPKE